MSYTAKFTSTIFAKIPVEPFVQNQNSNFNPAVLKPVQNPLNDQPRQHVFGSNSNDNYAEINKRLGWVDDAFPMHASGQQRSSSSSSVTSLPTTAPQTPGMGASNSDRLSQMTSTTPSELVDAMLCATNPGKVLDDFINPAGDAGQQWAYDVALVTAHEAVRTYEIQTGRNLNWNPPSHSAAVNKSWLGLYGEEEPAQTETDPSNPSWNDWINSLGDNEIDAETCGGVNPNVNLSSKQDQLRSEIRRLEMAVLAAVDQFEAMAKGQDATSWSAFVATFLLDQAIGNGIGKITALLGGSKKQGSETTHGISDQIIATLRSSGTKMAETLLKQKTGEFKKSVMTSASNAARTSEDFKNFLTTLFRSFELDVVTNSIGSMNETDAHDACCLALEQINVAESVAPTVIKNELAVQYINARRDDSSSRVLDIDNTALPLTWIPRIHLSGNGNIFGHNVDEIEFKTELFRQYPDLFETIKTIPLNQLPIRMTFILPDGSEIAYDGRSGELKRLSQNNGGPETTRFQSDPYGIQNSDGDQNLKSQFSVFSSQTLNDLQGS